MYRALVILLSAAILGGISYADDWPAWRGPRGDGVSGERNLPLTWSATQNVRWKVALPEAGNSTPIVWGDRVFLTQALDAGKRRAVIAFDRKDGKKLWQRELPCEVVETSHKQNPPCSASPITDGKAVYAHFASAGVVAYDFAGKQLWHRDLGPVVSRWGNGSSPILYKDLLIVFHGPGEPKTFLIALDKQTGKTVWQTDETAINSPVFGSWSTPILVKVGERDELVMPLPGDKVGGEGMFKGYDPNTGKELWSCKGLGNEIYAMPTPSAAGDLIVGISGHNGPLVAVKPGGVGDVTATHRVWRIAGKNPQRVGSGVFHDGRLYIADAPGTIQCLDPKSGTPLWKESLNGNLWGSMLLADGKIYVTNLEGETFVFAAGAKFKLLARNKIDEPIYAAPAVSNGEIFLRTYKHLYCIQTTAAAALKYNNDVARVTLDLEQTGKDLGNAVVENANNRKKLQEIHTSGKKKVDGIIARGRTLTAPISEEGQALNRVFAKWLDTQQEIIDEDFKDVVRHVGDGNQQGIQEVLKRMKAKEDPRTDALKAAQQKFARANNITLK